MNELLLLGRMALAIALCAIIGIEREFHGRPAGLRTHLLVGGGSALIMIIGSAVLELSKGSGGGVMSMDVARLIAGVMTGIGFLGAGTIIRQGDWVRGLTTAASVWFVAGIGVASGLGLYVIAAGATTLGFIVLFAFSQVESWLPNLTRRVLVLELPLDGKDVVRRRLRHLCGEHHVRTRLLSWEFNEDEGSATIRLLLSYWRPVDVIRLASMLQEETGATSVQVEQ